jgi:hypothetical protein
MQQLTPELAEVCATGVVISRASRRALASHRSMLRIQPVSCLRPCCAMLYCVDQAIDLKECDVYSYKSDGETDPFGEHETLYLARVAPQPSLFTSRRAQISV